MLGPTLPAFALMAVLMPGATPAPASAQQMQEQAPPAAEYGEEEIQAFAQASLEVQQLNDEWMPRLAEAESQQEAEQLRDEATSEMADAVRGEGLSLEEYNAIYDQARQDPELASEIQAYQQDAQ